MSPDLLCCFAQPPAVVTAIRGTLKETVCVDLNTGP
jgi:hypothetical protein